MRIGLALITPACLLLPFVGCGQRGFKTNNLGGGRGKQGQRGRAKLGHLSPKNSAPLGAIQAKSGLLLATPAACRPPTLLSVGDRR